ncbi:sulfite exporter TauE/SafE family protein [Halomonas denitrificans]|uniref:sulfite exporter TauE/SafE family protein n=1 Tax=Halomonas TaxID=2745 RepID=UPI001A901B85|nr:MULTISPECIES: sulfite exporter TauE/SafE family protein [Halomonas]MED5294473.1 sulfite exporter TauE/SafE family protein [Pseudomonadota bacterium]MBN8411996.1 sulfite exporter TauE/SafE family protein [Halomonas litopenaei]MBY5969989.1 sulfite exporter TauE/SafE family protein [Halomonas denitrificans]MBY5985654.1 sulfite exporter TauE/SafE family protein [Halomonas sp. DP5Y7-2]MBY6030159.1 sulfite exporter TauE/SafE family protein [Halomonas sp. DP8Y7-1]
MTLVEGAALLTAGIVAGFINVLAAGGSMLTLPLLMFLGLPPQVANGTNRVSITLQSVSAVANFFRAGARHIGLSLRLSVPAVLGSMLGVWLALQVSDALFETILMVVMVAAAVIMLLPQPKIDTRPLTVERLTPGIYLAMFVIGVYGGFLQVGVGILFMIVLYRMLKIDLGQVNAFKVLIILVYTLPALGIFLWHDQVRWSYGLVLAAGSMTGAWLAVKVNMSSRGAMVVKWLTVAVIAVIILRLALY